MGKVIGICLIWIAMTGLAWAEDIPEKIVSIKVSADKELVHPGGELTLTIKTKVSKEWHVQGPKPDLDFLIPTSAVLEDGSTFELGDIAFPKTVEKKFDFLDKPVRVLHGSFKITALVRVDSEAKPGVAVIRGGLTCQPCNDAACLPPEKVKFTIPVMITRPKDNAKK
ncbi:protein-disulfide reductase DsbD domain-containing protein [Acidobacteriota bacterium]